MKALTLTQPWATLVAIGAKQIETRSWSTNYRGKMAIHAAAGLSSIGGKTGLKGLVANEPFLTALQAWHVNTVVRPDYWLPFGAIVAMCDLVDCRSTTGVMGRKYADFVHDLSAQERAFGDYSPGRYAWILENIRALPEPIPAEGALGLWEWEPPL